MYDEAGKPIASVEVEYVVSVCISGHFHSVPVVFVSEERDAEKGAAACRYLNTSLHQSQVVTSPGFVAIQPTGTSVDVVSMTPDGAFAVCPPHSRHAQPGHRRRTAANDDVARVAHSIYRVSPTQNAPMHGRCDADSSDYLSGLCRPDVRPDTVWYLWMVRASP